MGAPGATARNDLYCYQPGRKGCGEEEAAGSWERKKTSGDMPPGRHGHSAVVMGDGMLVFAG